MSLSVGHVEAPLGVALCRRLCAFVEEVDKRDGRARCGVDHSPHHALTEGEGGENKPAEQESEKFFHDDEDKYMPCLAPHKGEAHDSTGQIYENYLVRMRFLYSQKYRAKLFAFRFFRFAS